MRGFFYHAKATWELHDTFFCVMDRNGHQATWHMRLWSCMVIHPLMEIVILMIYFYAHDLMNILTNIPQYGQVTQVLTPRKNE